MPRRWRWAAGSSTGSPAGRSNALRPGPGRPERAGPGERPLHRRDVHHHHGRRTLRGTPVQRGDYGYKATSVLLGESGLALALDRDRLSDLRGVLTPAAAMGEALMARFPAAGASLETSRLD